MQRLFPVLLLAFGIMNLYSFVETFTKELPGPFHFLFWETGLTGYRVKCLLFAAVFVFLAWNLYYLHKNHFSPTLRLSLRFSLSPSLPLSVPPSLRPSSLHSSLFCHLVPPSLLGLHPVLSSCVLFHSDHQDSCQGKMLIILNQ